MKALLFGDLRVEYDAADGDGAFDFIALHVLIAFRPPHLFSRRPGFDAVAVVPRFAFFRAAIFRGQRNNVDSIGIALCPPVRHINLGYFFI